MDKQEQKIKEFLIWIETYCLDKDIGLDQITFAFIEFLSMQFMERKIPAENLKETLITTIDHFYRNEHIKNYIQSLQDKVDKPQ